MVSLFKYLPDLCIVRLGRLVLHVQSYFKEIYYATGVFLVVEYGLLRGDYQVIFCDYSVKRKCRDSCFAATASEILCLKIVSITDLPIR